MHLKNRTCCKNSNSQLVIIFRDERIRKIRMKNYLRIGLQMFWNKNLSGETFPTFTSLEYGESITKKLEGASVVGSFWKKGKDVTIVSWTE